MATIGMFPPPPEVQGAVASIPGVRFSEGVVIAIDGEEPAGPESAGAVLLLAGGLAEQARANQFWTRAAETLRAAQAAPGLVRVLTFHDGTTNYLLALWRTHEDAMAFRNSQVHRAAMDELAETGNQYDHFAGLFRTERTHSRHVYCERCNTKNTMPAAACSSCGNALVDIYDVRVAKLAEPAQPV
ncbi:MAG: antibiotic biosynthesis monooxygenase family protein [Candidatus Dormibacteria bacterium]